MHAGPVGGKRIKRILRSRLPERFAGKLPPIVVEIAIGVTMAVAMTLARIAMVPVTGDRAPYAFVFVAMLGSAVLAGWRSGLLALVLGQWLAWTLIAAADAPLTERGHLLGGLAVSTLAQLIALAIVALYQREVDRDSAKRTERINLLDRALKEIDHRTANNYATMLALVLAQAKTAEESAARDALNQVAGRISAIAAASRKLAVASGSLDQVPIARHLHELCDQIGRGLARSDIRLECQFEDIVLDADRATCLSILVNEMLTNALKHAFPEDREGMIRVALKCGGGSIELTVKDNGVGIAAGATTGGTGLGQRLIETFVKQLRAKHEVSSNAQGTRHRIRFPR